MSCDDVIQLQTNCGSGLSERDFTVNALLV